MSRRSVKSLKSGINCVSFVVLLEQKVREISAGSRDGTLETQKKNANVSAEVCSFVVPVLVSRKKRRPCGGSAIPALELCRWFRFFSTSSRWSCGMEQVPEVC